MFIPVTQSVSTKGQLVIPKAIREALLIKPGTQVTLAVDIPSRILRVQPVPIDPIKAAIGAIRPKTGHKHMKRLLEQKYAEIKKEE